MLNKDNINDFFVKADEAHIKREKEKARELRRSQWWKNQLGHGQCFYCKKDIHPKRLTMDHIVPIIRGGKTNRRNVVSACKECNNNKKYLLPVEWQDYLLKLNWES